MSFSVSEGEKIAYLRPILSIFAGLTYQELPGASLTVTRMLAAINVSPHLSFNHAVHRYPQFLVFPWPIYYPFFLIPRNVLPID
jgi:hypothetical protein